MGNRLTSSPMGCCKRLTACLLAAACVAVCAPLARAAGSRPAKVHKESKRADVHEIEALEERWRQAMIKGDSKALEPLLDDDFTGISANGTLSTKQQYLHRLEVRANQFSNIELLDMKVRVEPSTVIATSQARVTGQLDGRPIDGVFRYTKVYGRKPGGDWVVLNFEATRVSGPRADDTSMHNGTPLNNNRHLH